MGYTFKNVTAEEQFKDIFCTLQGFATTQFNYGAENGCSFTMNSYDYRVRLDYPYAGTISVTCNECNCGHDDSWTAEFSIKEDDITITAFRKYRRSYKHERYLKKADRMCCIAACLVKFGYLRESRWPSKSDKIKEYLCMLWEKEYSGQGCLPRCYSWRKKAVTLGQIKYGNPAKIVQKKIDEFAKLVQAGVPLPPLVCLNGELIDGYHRYHAYMKCGRSELIEIYTNN